MKSRLIALLLSSSLLFTGCYDYRQVGGEYYNQATIERWCATANNQVYALQSVIQALETGDFVTAVTPLAEGNGYNITLARSNSIVIKYVDDVSYEVCAITPMIGVARDTDGIYYWTVKIGDAAITWLLDGYDKKIPAVGTANQAAAIPSIKIKAYTGDNYYWQINGSWLSLNGSFIPATPSRAEVVFADNGVDDTNADYVEFTLATGEKIQLPKFKPFKIGITDTNDAITITTEELTIPLRLPSDFKESDYSSIMAQMISNNATDTDIATKAASVWEVKVNKPTFLNGVCQNDASVTIRPIMGKLTVGDNSMLEVSIIDSKGGRTTSSRAITAGKIAIVDRITHTLTLITKGSLSADLITQTIGGTHTLIINGLLSGKVVIPATEYEPAQIDGDWNILRETLRKNSSYIDLTMNNITVVLDSGFESTKITSISLTEATIIGKKVFYDHRNLATASLPKVTDIGEYAFAYCYALTGVFLPEANSIGQYAFYNCKSLTEVSLQKATTIGIGAFTDCIELADISLSKATSIGESAFMDCGALTTVSLPEATTLGNFAFYKCYSLNNISLPKTTAIGSYAFDCCTALKNIRLALNKAITYFGYSVFSGVGTSLCNISIGQAEISASGATIGDNQAWRGDYWKSVSLYE